MLARLTSDELAKDVAGAEALISRHKENKAEIDTRVKEITRFTQKGNTLIAEKNFLSSEVGDRRLHNPELHALLCGSDYLLANIVVSYSPSHSNLTGRA